MRKSTPFQLLMSFLFLFTCIPCSGQVQDLARSTDEIDEWSQFRVYENRVLLFTPYVNFRFGRFISFQLETGDRQVLKDAIDEPKNVQFAPEGVFYTDYLQGATYGEGEHYLNFLRPDGQQTLSKVINEYIPPLRYIPEFATFGDGRYYVTGYINGKYVVWESDGTDSGTQVIHESDYPYSGLVAKGDELIMIMSPELGTSEILGYKVGGTPTKVIEISGQRSYYLGVKGPFRFAGHDGERFYLAYKDSTNTANLIYTNADGTQQGEFLTGYEIASISFFGEKFMLYGGGTDGRLIGRMDSPGQLTKVPLAAEFGDTLAWDLFPYSDRILSTYSLKAGLELGFLNEEDSVELFNDLTGDPQPSLPPYRFNPGSQRILTLGDSVVYSVFTNGKDSHYYLYQISRNQSKALAKIKNPYDFNALFYANNKLYWFENEEEETILKKIDLQSSPVIFQESPDPNPKTWYREFLTATSGRYRGSEFWTYSQPRKLEVGRDGSVFLGFEEDKGALGRWLYSSHSKVIDSLNGADILVKTDENGEVLWQTSFGGVEDLVSKRNRPSALWTLDANGDVVVAGIAERLLILGNNSFNLRDTTACYLAKINGTTGEFEWYNIIGKNRGFPRISVHTAPVVDEESGT
ncbi:MAG: hypothetical protein AAGI38_24365 [Bacteroidota bacterium]